MGDGLFSTVRGMGWVKVTLGMPMAKWALPCNKGTAARGDLMEFASLERMAREGFGLEVSGPTRELAAGNINRSVVITTDDGAFVLQQLNDSVFGDVKAVMENVLRVCERLEANNLAAMRFTESVDGLSLVGQEDSWWRCYRYIEGAATPSIVTPEDAQSTARTFGRFASAIDGLELHEHLAGYHDFDARVAALDAAVVANSHDRLSGAEPAIERLISIIDRLRLSGGYDAWREAPVRNVHNDAKGPNCIVGASGARTIIDLDTTMPGTLLADIGELVRSSTRHLDDPTPGEVMAQIEAVNRGFLAGYGQDLVGPERAAMLLAGPLLTTENSVRFLADHLVGDTYYGAACAGQNLERAEYQLALAERLIDAIEWATAG